MDYHQKFHTTHALCPACKNTLDHGDNKVTCSKCGFEEYSSPMPAVSLMVLKNNSFLLAKRAVDPFKGTWDVIGGFVEAGETGEEAAMREMKEETGLEAAVEAYLGSMWDMYAGRPTLALMYVMKVLSNQEPKAADDVSELKWFSFDTPPENLAFQHLSVTIQKAHQYIQRKDSV